MYAISTSGKAEPVQVSPRPGDASRWSCDGRRLFFRQGTAMMAVDVRTSAAQIAFGPERRLFETSMPQKYDVDANRDFYTLAPVPGAATQTQIQLRTRWCDEVDRLMRGSDRRP